MSASLALRGCLRALNRAPGTPLSAALLVPSRNHTGYIAFEGRPGVYDNEQTRFQEQSLRLNMQPVTKMTFSLDPFHPKVKTTRDLMVTMSGKRVRATNLKCMFKTEILSNGAAPEIKMELKNGKTILFKSGTMQGSDLLNELNKIVLPLVEEEKANVQTKAAKVSAAGGGKAPIKGKKGKKK